MIHHLSLVPKACMLELQVKDLFSSGQWILNLEEQTLETILKREMTDRDMEVPSESFHRSSWDSRTCYPRRAFNQGFTDDLDPNDLS
jgi:hypothetical protein